MRNAVLHLAILQMRAASWIKSRVADEGGASLVEYALLLGLIAVVAIGALTTLGHATNNTLTNTGGAISGIAP